MSKTSCRRLSSAFLLAAILSLMFVTLPLRRAVAAPVISMEPLSGVVGTTVNVNGSIDTQDGPFTVRWNQSVNVTTGVATGLVAAASFTVPPTAGAQSGKNITVELIDDVAGTWSAVNFTLFTSVFIRVEVPIAPKQLQEGSSTRIWINVTGGEPNAVYSGELAVKNPANQTHTAMVSQLNTTSGGEGVAGRIYPTDFTGASTNLTGRYVASFNGTASQEFLVGLTDKIEYRIGETVRVKASGYKTSETVTVTIRSGTTLIAGFPKNATATTEGIVTQSWAVPPNSKLGTYQVQIVNASSGGTRKTPSDTQDFQVSGVVCNVQTKNLAGEGVANAVVEIYNATTPSILLTKGNTNSTGWVKFVLNTGLYDLKAFFKNALVANRSKEQVTTDVNFELLSGLVNVAATAKTEAGMHVPFVALMLEYNYTTRENRSVHEKASVQTNTSGVALIYNLFTNTTYTLEAKRYGIPFLNRTFTVESTPTSGLIALSIVVSTHTFNVHALDSRNANATDIQVKIFEWGAGTSLQLDSKRTDANGDASFTLPLGKYLLKAFMNDEFLNETIVSVSQDLSELTLSLVTADLDVRVLVLDYLGQPISNANVTIERRVGDQYLVAYSRLTGQDGHAAFNSGVGGDSRISIRVAGRLVKVETRFLDSGSSELSFRLGEYVAVFGFVMETGLFVLLLFILVYVVTMLVLSKRYLLNVIGTIRKR